MKSRGPPILPMYKADMNKKKKSGGWISICIAVLLPIFAVCLLVFFFLSIYMGSMYLQDHIEEESPNGILNKIGLPNTRNVIQKWSITNLHGVDLTKLGPPPKVIPLGLGTAHRQHYLSNSSSAALEGFKHRIGDGIHHINQLGQKSVGNVYHSVGGVYGSVYNSSSKVVDGAYEAAHQGSAKLRGWLNSFHDLNATTNSTHSTYNNSTYNAFSTYKIKDYFSEKRGTVMKSITELKQQGVKSVQNMRGVAPQPPLNV